MKGLDEKQKIGSVHNLETEKSTELKQWKWIDFISESTTIVHGVVFHIFLVNVYGIYERGLVIIDITMACDLSSF